MTRIEAARRVFENYQREVRPDSSVIAGASATIATGVAGYRVSLAVRSDRADPEWAIEGGLSTGGTTAGLVAATDAEALTAVGGLLVQFSNLLRQIEQLSR
jgi:hypothetical protein